MNRKLVLSQGNTHKSTQIRNRAPVEAFLTQNRSRAAPSDAEQSAGQPRRRAGPAHPFPMYPEAFPRLSGRAALPPGATSRAGAGCGCRSASSAATGRCRPGRSGSSRAAYPRGTPPPPAAPPPRGSPPPAGTGSQPSKQNPHDA